MRPVSANCLFKPLHTKFRESAVIEILESETVSSLYTLLVPNAPCFSQSRFCRPKSTPSDVIFVSIIPHYLSLDLAFEEKNLVRSDDCTVLSPLNLIGSWKERS